MSSEEETAATLREREEEAEQIGNTDPKGTVRLTRGAKRDLDEYGSTDAYCILDDQKFVVEVKLDDCAPETAVSRQCKKCGAEDWDQDGATTCGSCGWRPRRERRQELEGVLNDGE